MSKNKIIIFTLFLMPLIISGCYKKVYNPPVAEPVVADTVFTKEIPAKGGYRVKYPSRWQILESSSGKIKDLQDIVTFKISDTSELEVDIYEEKEKTAVLNSYAIESENQTQLAGVLAADYLVADATSNKRWQLVAAVYGEFYYVIKNSNPGSEDFSLFLNNFNFLEIPQSPAQPVIKKIGDKVKLKLYFDDLNKETSDCLPDAYREVLVQNPDVEIGLIPLAIKSLIQVSSSKELSEQNLSSAIPIYTRLLSFGYENNTAIVNFNDELNKGGGSCSMAMRRGQIEKTLKALNEVSNLLIKKVEIQINGQTEAALAP